MTEKDTLHGWSRRAVLRRTAIATAAAGIGIPALSGTTLAHGCPRTPGYWMNHDWPGDGDDPDVEENTGLEQVNQNVPGVTFPTESDGQAFLKAPARGDKGQIMATHLIATVLNYQSLGAGDDCLTTGIADVDDDGTAETVDEIVEYAQQWLYASGWYMDGPPLRSWTVPEPTDPVPTVDGWVADGEVLKDYLDAFNNNRLNVPACDCDAEEPTRKPRETSRTGTVRGASGRRTAGR